MIHQQNNSIRRSFNIGSEWLYFKIYTGYKSADVLLTEIVKPVSAKLFKEGLIKKWFFIRYGDPYHHIRLRFLLKNQNCIEKVILMIHQELSKKRYNPRIWKTQIDTYNRELGRYGKDTMELSETIFYYDSCSIVEFLDAIEGDQGEELRWLFALRSTDSLLNAFNYSLKERATLIGSLRHKFGQEFNMSRALKTQLDRKYRDNSKKVRWFMELTDDSNHKVIELIQILKRRENDIETAVKKYGKLKTGQNKNIEIDNLLSSYIHMLMNRLFKSQNRLCEMVCYDFLHRYYNSRQAINKRLGIA